MARSQIPNPKKSQRDCVSRSGFGIWVLGFGICLAASGCAKAQAKNAPDGPPLQVPSPPARVLAPVEEPVNAEVPPPEPAAPAAAAPPRTAPPRTAQPRRPEQPAPAAAETAPPPATPPRELRATSPATEKDVRDTLARVNTDLSRVDYRRLSADARSQYDQAKRFTQQAEQALKDRNVVFAATLADKAEALAAQLVAR